MATPNNEWSIRRCTGVVLARIGIVLAFGCMLAACGGGGSGPSGSPGGPGATPTTVMVSGKITFDRIPFDATRGAGLNPDAIVLSPARGVVVEAISGGAVIASTATDEGGDYSLAVAANTQMFIRVRAQMRKTGAAPTWNFRVLNNTNSDALYALDGSTFNSGTADSTRNLRASSGWTGSAYTQTRAAAPFAILDTVYQAANLIVSAASSAVFEPLDFYWSSSNTPTLGRYCIDDGDIGTTFYTSGGDDETECTGSVLEGIYVLGRFETGDTDEFDQHVITHEFGHYLEAKFSRSDSIGGSHANGDKLDLRVAFSEGWSNAFAGMVFDDPEYRDSFGGMARDHGFNLEIDDTSFGDGGWFSETSIGEVLWDAFDAANEPGDTVSLGFGPIFTALAGQQKTTPALTSIFSFAQALRQVAPAQASGINALLAGERIFGSDAFGTGETNNGGDASVLPIYRSLVLNQGPQSVCVSAVNGDFNTLGYYKFFRLDLSAAALVTFNVIGTPNGPATTAAVDPDIYVHRNGSIVASGISAAASSETISQVQLQSGTYVVEVYDYALESGSTPRCMTVSATGTSL